jgi:hypothetical protein
MTEFDPKQAVASGGYWELQFTTQTFSTMNTIDSDGHAVQLRKDASDDDPLSLTFHPSFRK